MATTRFSQKWNLFSSDHRSALELALEQFLMDEGRFDCFPSLNYILAELAGNADKANLKRAHFALAGLDINDEKQYSLGMDRFKEAVSGLGPALAEALDQRGAFVKVWFGRDGDDLVFGVHNNAPLLALEEERYREKLKIADQFHNIQEVLGTELDRSEGGGLGLIIAVLMLRKIGLDDNHLTLTSDDQGTTARLVIPPRAEPQAQILAQAAVEAIDHIPQFPDHVMAILRILEDPSKSFTDVGAIVRRDPNLIAGLLRAANSPVYRQSRQIETVEEAVSVLGLQAIRELLIAVTAERLLIQDFNLGAVKKLMEHSIEVAWYCRELAKAAKVNPNEANLFVCAMLHDFGKIIVNALIPGLTEKIGALCRTKGWNNFSAETLTDGYNHSLVGAALARKWQFPDRIVEAIEFHHLPLEASRAHRNVVCLTYLGDFLSYWAAGEVKADTLSPLVLEQFPRKAPSEWIETFEQIIERRNPAEIL